MHASLSRARLSPCRSFAIGIGAVVLVAGMSAAVAADGGPISGFPRFYESSATKNCSEGICIVQLSPVPNNALLQATNVSCSVQSTTPGPRPVIRLHMMQGPLTDPKAKESFFLDAANPEASTNVFGMNKEIRSFFAARTRPIFATSIDLATQINLTCKLSGDLIRP